MSSKSILLILLAFVLTAHGARILVYCPTPAISHQVMFQPIVRELTLRGHQVVSISSDPLNDPNLTNLTEISIKYSYNAMHSRFNFADRSELGISQINFIKDVVNTTIWNIYDPQLSSPEIKALIQNKDEHFDLVIVEWLFATPLMAFSERFNCPLIGVTSLDLLGMAHWAVGNSINPSYYADIWMSFSQPTSFFERAFNTLFTVWNLNFLHTVIYRDQDQVVKKHFGENSTSVVDLQQRVSVLLTNAHPVFIGARPVVPTVVDVSGICKKPRKPLPKDLQTFLDNAIEGVIYFSLGSNVKSSNLKKEKIDMFIETFKDLPYKVLWKFETDNIPEKHDNIFISKWFPQSDVLYHPNIKLFITQGGLQSWEEALHGNVPLIGFPFFGDQYWNVDRMEKLGIGIKMDIETVDKQSLTNAIQSVINNPSYYKKVKELSSILNDQPIKPLDRAIYWIEYVLRHGYVDVLHSPTMTIPWYQYFLVDVIAFFFLICSIVCYLMYFVLKLLLRSLGFSNKTRKVKRS